jgi:hypothetical protein
MRMLPSTPHPVAFLFALVGLTCPAPGDEPGRGPAVQIRLSREGDPRAAFEAVGLDPATLDALAADPVRGAEVFRVTTVTAGDGPGGSDRPPLLGTYRVEGRVLRFRPRFPLEPGLRYRATLRAPAPAAGPVSAEFRPLKPGPTESTTVVTRVAPSADTLPENLLKFYIEFSAPMSRGEAYDHVRLLDAKGKPIELPFLELGEELWDPSGTRFTLLFDPGRIKTGLKPREEAGPVLEAGKAYTLVVDRGGRDAAGNPLMADFRKPFRAGPADATPPDPKTWRLDAPRAGSKSPLVVRFPEPLDRALLRRVLAVADASGRPLEGRVAVADDERSWSFTPARPWAAGRHALLADRSLEDLAGNGIGRPFEVDVFRKVEELVTPEIVEVPFAVEAGGAGPPGD